MKRFTPILAGIAILLALRMSVQAAVTANSIVTPQTPKMGDLQLLATASCTGIGTPAACCSGVGTGCTAGTYYTIYTAGTNGSICKALWMDTDDGTQTHLITIQKNNGTTNVGGTALLTVLNAGFATATPSQNLLAPAQWPGLPTDSDGNPFLLLNSGDTLKATFASAFTAATFVDIHAVCADF